MIGVIWLRPAANLVYSTFELGRGTNAGVVDDSSHVA